MDAITLLKDDHKTVEQLFKRFEKAGDSAHVQKRQVVDRIIESLSVHAAIEEQFLYPVARATVPGSEDMALESLEEHHVVKWLLSELDSMDPAAERFDAKVTVLIENVRHHVKEEENDLFPKIRKELGRSLLNDLGDAMAAARKTAPTHPHPRSPDTPPGNLIAGNAAGVADRISDTVSGLTQGSAMVVGDIIAAVLGRKTPRVSPTGSRVARETAARVRANGADAAETVIDAARNARETGKQTVQRSRHTTRKTASPSRNGAKRTASTAKRGATSTATTAKRGAKRTARTAKSSAKGVATSARKASSSRKATKRTATTAKRGATTTRRAANQARKSTTTTAKRAVRRTASTAKRSSR